MHDELILDAVDVAGPTQWRWRLTTVEDQVVAEHIVDLDAGTADYEGFSDLHNFVALRRDPRGRALSEAQLVDRIGNWIGEEVLGPIGSALLRAAPATVRVQLCDTTNWLSQRPLELATVDGVPLAMQDIAFVYESRRDPVVAGHWRRNTPDRRLRMLGVFSMPVGERPLALRRERYELTRLLHDIATNERRDVELCVVQYGVTRERLKRIIALGWDLVHFSGHGQPGRLVLERDDGSSDMVDPAEFASLLQATGRRVQLITLSSCQSATEGVAATLETLGLAQKEDLIGRDLSPTRSRPLPALAHELSDRFSCAVVAMRYPIRDDFAVAFSNRFYARVLGDGQPVASALHGALQDALNKGASAAVNAIALATPVVFGDVATTLRLPAPANNVSSPEHGQLIHTRVPEQPRRFVGRTKAMVRASAALAPNSEYKSVLLHGMAGAGKTSIALELVYTHEDAFTHFLWYEVPVESEDADSAIVDFLGEVQQAISDFVIRESIDDPDQFAKVTKALTRALNRTRLLIVIDGADPLLTAAGEWRDSRWKLLVGSLQATDGLCRLIMTSRRSLRRMTERVLVLQTNALSRDEAVIFARQLPHLSRLINGTHSEIDAVAGRKLAVRALAMVQGHPKLMEFADADAASPERLKRQLRAVSAAWKSSDSSLDEFLVSSESSAQQVEYLDVLAQWTRASVADLPSPARQLFELLCCVEANDRQDHMLASVWPVLSWTLSPQPSPDLEPLIEILAARALIECEATNESRLDFVGGHSQDGDRDGPMISFRIHPAVANVGRRDAPDEFRSAVDHNLSGYWRVGFEYALSREGSESGRMILTCAFHAVPYLTRLQDWYTVAMLLEHVLYRDKASATAARVRQRLTTVAEQVTDPADRDAVQSILVRANSRIDRNNALLQYQDRIADALESDDYLHASVVSADFAILLRDYGDLSTGLAQIDDAIEYGMRARLNEWEQLGLEIQRLQFLSLQGDNDSVLDEAAELAARLELMGKQSSSQMLQPWVVVELCFDVGRHAALEVKQWETALKYNRRIIDSRIARDASQYDIATAKFNDYRPMLELGRIDDCRSLLHECVRAFTDQRDPLLLGVVYGALAEVDAHLGRVDDAVEMARRSLSYAYMVIDAEKVASAHDSLATYLSRTIRSTTDVIAHRLAACLIESARGSGRLAMDLARLGNDIYVDPESTPASYDELCDRVEAFTGVKFRAFMRQLTSSNGDNDYDSWIETLLGQAFEHCVQVVATEAQKWSRDIMLVAIVAHADSAEREALKAHFQTVPTNADCAGLCSAICRILDGDRDPNALAAGLDSLSAFIVHKILDESERVSSSTDGDPSWQPVVNDFAAVTRGELSVSEEMADFLNAGSPLAIAIGRVISGEHDAQSVTAGLDSLDAAIVRALVAKARADP